MMPELSMFPEQASNFASKVDALYGFALAMSAFFSLLIALVIFVFFIRFRRREAGPMPRRGYRRSPRHKPGSRRAAPPH